jgi:hypothetical protein
LDATKATKPGEALVARTNGLIAGYVLASVCLAGIASAHAADGPQWPRVPEEERNGRTRRPGRCRIFRRANRCLRSKANSRRATGSAWGRRRKIFTTSAGPTSALVSRLTYDGLRGHSAEVFGRADHTSGVYVKGYLGGGILTKGDLNDEDFEPVIVPYSSTMSNHKDGQMLLRQRRPWLQSRAQSQHPRRCVCRLS